MKVTGNPVSTRSIVFALRLIAAGGGKMTKNVRDLCGIAADRLDELDERVAIMAEGNILLGGDAGEKH